MAGGLETKIGERGERRVKRMEESASSRRNTNFVKRLMMMT